MKTWRKLSATSLDVKDRGTKKLLFLRMLRLLLDFFGWTRQKQAPNWFAIFLLVLKKTVLISENGLQTEELTTLTNFPIREVGVVDLCSFFNCSSLKWSWFVENGKVPVAPLDWSCWMLRRLIWVLNWDAIFMSGLEPFFLISEAAVVEVRSSRSSLEWSWVVENDEVPMTTIKAAKIRKHKIICGFILMFLDVRSTAEW